MPGGVSSPIDSLFCDALADIYYNEVRKGGESSFKNAQKAAGCCP
jgi:hypothetical protein